MTSLVQHLHAFAREVKLTEDEWAEGIRFLTECGRMCSGRRQEFALLSDTLGLSMLVTALNHRKPRGCTESTVFGPFHVDGAPHCEHGDDIDPGASGEPCYVRGRVRTLDGRAVAGARLTAGGGARASVQSDSAESGADGSFVLATRVAPTHAVPHDGPVGRMLSALGRHPWRPAHLHVTIDAPGCERLVTHLFRNGSEHLDSDAVFAVRSSLVADWVRHEPGRTPDGGRSEAPYYTVDFDFVLQQAQETPT
jgi:hydroxyquinol 1,2-dioxygenase